MEGDRSLDTIDNASSFKQEAVREGGEQVVCTYTPVKEPVGPANGDQSDIFTRSARHNAAGTGSSLQMPSSASRSAETDLAHNIQNEHRPEKEGEPAASLTDSKEMKSKTQMLDSEKNWSGEKKHAVDQKDDNGSNEMSSGAVKNNAFTSSPDKKQDSTPSSAEEARTQSLQSNKNINGSFTEAASQSPKKEEQNLTNGNLERNEALNDENINEFDCEYDEEERRRRIRLSHILESSCIIPDNRETGRGTTQAAVENAGTLKDPVSHMPATDYNMIAGDGQKNHLKTKAYQNNKTIPKDPETESDYQGLSISGNLEAGGDAGVTPGVPHCVNKIQVFRHTAAEYLEKPPPFRQSAVDSVQMHQIIKSTEKISKGTSTHKGELVLEADPHVIPIKPISALSDIGSQESESALDGLNAMPFIPPDSALLYQPEVGVLKSKPVPKPTRGRRGRRRSPTGYRSFLPHPEMRFPEQARYVSGPQYQRYMLPEFGPSLPVDYCEVVPGHGGDFVAFPSDAGREMMGGGDESISLGYPSNRWCCKDDLFKLPQSFYAPAPRGRGRGNGSSGGRGRPRGRRGSGGVRQYLQHRLLWARYTGRSQEALDRVLSIINSNCSLQEDLPKEVPSPRLCHNWGMPPSGGTPVDPHTLNVAPPDVTDGAAGLYGRLDGRLGCAAERPTPFRGGGGGGEGPCSRGEESVDPYAIAASSSSPYYAVPPRGRAGGFSSNISNMMTGGSNSSTSILSQSGIASNAVVDGNGYIVYLNQDDSTEFQQQSPIPFVPSETRLGDREDLAATVDRAPLRSSGIKLENDVRKTEDMTQPQPACVGVEASSIVPNKMVVEGIPSNSNLAEMGATAETAAVAAMPLEGSLTSSVTDGYPEKENGKQMTTGRKRGTPKSTELKTPVSPVKEPKVSKRHSQASEGRQKKKVRRSLTFSSPIKQEETLRATENIANALTNTSPESEVSATCSVSSTPDFLPSSTPLPSISNLLHTSTNAGISINIHVTNDANKDRGAPHTSSDDVGAGSRVLPGTLEQSNKTTVRADMVSRPGEATPHVHYPVPRYTVEWHGDYHQEPPPPEVSTDQARRYQDHVLPVSVASTTTASRFRYPYRDPNSSHGYYSQQRPFPVPSTPLDRYYTSDFTKEWTEVYSRYPSEHFLSSYEAQHPSVPPSYPAAHWGSEWSRNPDMYVEPYQKHHPGSRTTALDPDMREIPDMRDLSYAHFHRAAAAPYPRAQPEYLEEMYTQHRSPYDGYGGSAMVDHHVKERLVATVPEGIHDARPQEDYDTQRLHRPWSMTNCTAGTQDLQEGTVGQMVPAEDSPPHLQPPVECSALEPEHMDTSEAANQLPEEM